MSDPKTVNDVEGSKTAKPFHEGDGEDAGGGVDQTPHVRADAVGDPRKKEEMPKTTQREE